MNFSVGIRLGSSRRNLKSLREMSPAGIVWMCCVLFVVTSVFQGMLYWLPLYKTRQLHAHDRVDATVLSLEPLRNGVRARIADPETGAEQVIVWSAEQAADVVDLLNAPSAQIPCLRQTAGALEPIVFACPPAPLRIGFALFLTIFLGALAGALLSKFAWMRRHQRLYTSLLVSPPLVSALVLSVATDAALWVLLHLLALPCLTRWCGGHCGPKAARRRRRSRSWPGCAGCAVWRGLGWSLRWW